MRRAWRPVALALVLAGSLSLVPARRGGAADDAARGTPRTPSRTELVASASARVAAAGPFVAGLPLEAGFATSTVEVVGHAARAESMTMSAGAASLFLGLAGAPPVVPEPTRADSTGRPDAERAVAAPAGDFVRAGHERAHAGPGRAEAVTELGDITLGAASVAGGSSTAGAGEGGVGSRAVVGELRLGGAGGPEVRLSQLVWEAGQRVGAPAEASFSIGSGTVGGQPVAVGSPEQLTAAVDAVNAALVPQGIRIEVPAVTAGAAGGRVGPLRIELRDPPLNRAVAGAAYSPVAPSVNQAQESLAAAAADPRVDQALLGANVALTLALGNGGVGAEIGGAMAGITEREVPDLGSLLGGSNPRPPIVATPSARPVTSGDGEGGGGNSDSELATGPARGAFDVPSTGAFGRLPAPGGGSVSPAVGGPSAEPPLAGGAPPAGGAPLAGGAGPGAGAPERPGPERPVRLPAPLAAAVLATGLGIAGLDRLARRRTAVVVAGLRSAAGLGSTLSGPGPGRRSVVAAGVALMSLGGLALVPSRVPAPSGGDELAAGAPIPSAAAGAPVDTGVPAAGSGAPGETGPATGSITSPAAAASGRDSRGAAGAAGGSTGPGDPRGRRGPAGTGAGATRPTTATGPAGGNDGAAAAAPGTVTRGRHCPGGEMQDRNSTYSPPCLEFSGDNGGVTGKGVSGDTITIAMREPETFDAGVSKQGQISDSPADLKRTVVAYVDYFNRVYQTYGRTVQVVFYKPKVPLFAGVEGGYQEEANADALTVGQEIKAFADLTASAPSYADALVRQRVIGFGTYHMSKTWYQARAPWAWGNLPDCTWISEQSVDYLVKRLAHSPARFAGDPAMRTKPRAIGLVVPDSPWYQECADHAERLYQAAGYRFARRVNYPLNFNQSSQTATNVVAQMKAAGVTSVMCMCDPLLPYFATPQANQQSYHPEWLVAGFGATDTDIVGQFYDQAQWSHAFGMGVVGELRSGYESESYRAYKAVRHDEPAQLRDISYYPLLWFFSCLQMAGPNLNPKTFEAGCFALPPRQGELGLIHFGPGDYTAVSDAREIYWDPQATSSWNGRKGRYVATLGGKRFSGPWPEGEPPLPPPQ